MNEQKSFNNGNSTDNRNVFSMLTSHILLAITWVCIAIMLLAFTEGWLAPWDTKPFSPSPDLWQFTVNRFFETGIGSLLPTTLFISSSAALFWFGRRKAQARTVLAWQYVLINTALITSVIPISAWAIQLGRTRVLDPQVVSYERFLPAIVTMGGVFVIWLVLQFASNIYNHRQTNF